MNLKQNKPLVSIFLPTFNRSDLIYLALDSIDAQTNRNFEVIIIDDGSTDNTAEVIKKWSANKSFKIAYYYQENSGKHVAWNNAIRNATGELLITLDSDDSMLPDCIEKIEHHWTIISKSEPSDIIGIAGLCLTEDGTISGEPYPYSPIDASYYEIRRFCRMNGERREAIRLDILKMYPYPIINGEKHIRPTLLLKRLGRHYRLRFTNEILEINRHTSGGISDRRFEYRMKNPAGMALYYLEEITHNRKYYTDRDIRKKLRQFIRFSLHTKNTTVNMKVARNLNNNFQMIFPVMGGYYDWLFDTIKIAIKRII